MTVTMERALYRLGEAAAVLGISKTSMYGLLRSGQIEAVKIGSKTRRITAVELRRYVASLDAPRG